MALYRSPSGELLDIPPIGVNAIRSLGWVPVEGPKPVPAKSPAKKK